VNTVFRHFFDIAEPELIETEGHYDEYEGEEDDQVGELDPSNPRGTQDDDMLTASPYD
jgi:hypothetical protein